MHEFKRAAKIREEIQIGGDIIKIDISADAILSSFRRRQIDLLNAEQQVKQLQKQGVSTENIDAALDTYGNALISFFQLIFGEDGTAKILAFYENNYVEMTEEVVPYISENIMPQIQSVLADQKAKLKQKYVNKRGMFRR